MNEEDLSNDVSAVSERLDEGAAYAALSRTVLADRTLDDVMDDVALLARRVLPGDSDVSVTLVQDGRATTAAFTGAVAVDLDERQYDKGSGPCLDAAASGEKIKLSMAEPDDPYPDWRAAAGRRGVMQTLSVGFPVAAPTVGALNAYNSSGTPFSDDAERIMGNFASFAGIVLASAGLVRNLAELAAQLEAAVRSRAVIDQAKGVVMAQNRCTSDEAFQVLVRTSQSRNVKLRTLAEEILVSVASRDKPGHWRSRR